MAAEPVLLGGTGVVPLHEFRHLAGLDVLGGWEIRFGQGLPASRVLRWPAVVLTQPKERQALSNTWRSCIPRIASSWHRCSSR